MTQDGKDKEWRVVPVPVPVPAADPERLQRNLEIQRDEEEEYDRRWEFRSQSDRLPW